MNVQNKKSETDVSNIELMSPDADKRYINEYMTELIEHQEMASGALIVRQYGNVVYTKTWGSCNVDSIFRMMSMTKCITAVGILKLMDQGKLSIDDEIDRYIPGFADMQVAADDRYVIDMKNPKRILLQVPLFKLSKVKTVSANRKITIRDLLSHSSGLEQGAVGLIAMLKMKAEDKTLQERVDRYTHYPLDFQPGEGTSYSPLAGFDILGRITEIVSGMRLEDFLQTEICKPLDMENTTFFLNEEQKKRLVPVYVRKKNMLVNVTGTDKDMPGVLKQKKLLFEEGSGGIFSTLEDYDNFASMLAAEGKHKEIQFLKPETVLLMQTEGARKHLEPEPGMTWGLGVKIRQNPKAAGSHATEGTYGWSGAFGTHFFISPRDGIEAVFLTNRADLGGSGSYISTEVEKLVFGIWGEKSK